MNAHTQRATVAGPAGGIEVAIDSPAAPCGLAVLCHPHPLHGGTMENKVVQTLARAFVQLGWRALRFNFRGVGGSGGAWDGGRGEVDDALAVVSAFRGDGEAIAFGGFSFGGYVASQAAARSAGVRHTVLVAPAVTNFSVAPVSHDGLVVHGEEDDIVPLPALLDWARPLSQPVVVIPGAGHFFHGQLTLLKNLIVRALR